MLPSILMQLSKFIVLLIFAICFLVFILGIRRITWRQKDLLCETILFWFDFLFVCFMYIKRMEVISDVYYLLVAADSMMVSTLSLKDPKVNPRV